MAENNIELQERKSGQTVNTYYPVTKAKNVTVTPSNNVPSTVKTAEDALNALGELAFDDGDSLVYLKESTDTDDGTVPNTEIDDTVVSLTKTWSSSKLKQIFELLGVSFDDNLNPSK